MSPRKLKPFEVETITNNETGISAVIFLDREEKTFFSMVGDTRIEAKTAAECRAAAWTALNAFRPFVWEKVISVVMDEVTHHYSRKVGEVEEDRFNAHFEISISRYQRADSGKTGHLGAKVWLTRGFQAADVEDLSDPFRDRWRRESEGRDDVILPYTDETWTKLWAIKQGIDLLYAKLSELVRDGGKKLLALQVQSLLPSSKEPTP